MSAQRIAGIVAAASAAGILVLALASSVAGAWGGPGWTVGTGTAGTGIGPAMMGGAGMMGAGHGPGMMGGGYGMMGGGYGSGSATQSAAPIADAPTVTVTARDASFSPGEIVLSKDKVNLTLVNEGVVLHDLTIPAMGVRVAAAAGQTATVGLRDLRPGRYEGYCSVPGHAQAGMRLTVVVE